MKIPRQRHNMIVFAVLYVIFLTTMILSALWKRHDSTTLILHISLLTNFFLVIGLLFWFGERWKYFKMTVLIVFMIGCIFATIHDWNRKDPWGYIFYPIWFLWGLYCLKEEIVKVKTTDDIQDASNEVLSGSEK